MSEEYDYSAFQEGDSEKKQEALKKLADKLQEKNERIKSLESEMETLKNEKKDLVDNVIPTALGHIEGVYKLADGRVLTYKNIVRAGLAKDEDGDNSASLEWLIENGHGAIVKTDFKFAFGKDTENQQKIFLEHIPEIQKLLNEQLKDESPILDWDKSRGVHWRTLDSWFKNQTELGTEIPDTVITTFTQSDVKLKT